MRLLLDTHVVLWALADTRKLSGRIARLIGKSSNDIVVSAVSALELSVKRSAGSRNAPAMSAARMLELARDAGYHLLGVTPEHAALVESIAVFHGDPYDRLLLAQALLENMRLVTHDAVLAGYGPPVLHF